MAENNKEQTNKRANISYARVGMNTDSSPDLLKPGQVTFALNAQIENLSGEEVAYQNEQGNLECVHFPKDYVVIGLKAVPELNRVFYFLTSPGGNSMIAQVENGSCECVPIIDDKDADHKLNFNIDFPIRKVVTKITNCSAQLYWTDGLNPRRYLDLEDMPWKEEINPLNDFKPIKLEGALDVNKLLVQPNFSIPELEVESVEVGGSLVTGAYQFAVQYCNSLGEGYTSFYNVTNPASIRGAVITTDMAMPTSNALTVKVSNLDTTGLYEYYNLAVIQTVNDATQVKLMGTYPISGKEIRHTLVTTTGLTELSIQEVFEKYPYYDTAQGVFEVDNVIGWYSLEGNQQINYQKIWNQAQLKWISYRLPYNQFESYANGINSSKYRGYMRDEVYAFEGCFILKNGKQTDACHIPGRPLKEWDLYKVDASSKDFSKLEENNCDVPPTSAFAYEVYNTATNEGYVDSNSIEDDSCYIGPYERGEMAYWESEELYDNNPIIWGDLAGKPIRHHRFPDIEVSKHYEKRTRGNVTEYFVFPLGVEVDAASLYNAIQNSDLTQDQKDQIVGFKILRGNRVNNKSVVAKGLLHNVGEVWNEGKKYLYANYPFNDVGRDPFYTTYKVPDHSGFNHEAALNGFTTEDSRKRFVFHSPDTHFFQPTLNADGQYLKVECIEAGQAESHFVPVKNNAEHKFMTRKTIYASAGIALAGGFEIGQGTFGWPSFSLDSFMPTYQSMMEVLEKVAPYTNFALNFNSLGIYDDTYPVHNNGNKNRKIDFISYVTEGLQKVEEGNTLNNIGRESAVYIHTKDPLDFTHHMGAPRDTSRYNLGSILGTTDVNYEAKSGYVILIKDQLFPGRNFYSRGLGRNLFTMKGKRYLIDGAAYVVAGDRTEVAQGQPNNSDIYSGYIEVYPEGHNKVPPISGELVPVKESILSPKLSYYSRYHETLYIRQGTAGAPERGDSPHTVTRYTGRNRISSYYGAIKRSLPRQWGRMYSYETIDTGYYQNLYDEEGRPYESFKPVFGGDIYINRFAYKSKHPFFKQHSVDKPHGSDTFFDEEGNLSYPMYWISHRPLKGDIDLEPQLEKALNEVIDTKLGNVLGNLATGASLGVGKAVSLTAKLFKEIYEKLGVANLNLDLSPVDNEGLYERGYFYMFAYGINYFFVESEVNVDLRQGYNELEGNFYPNVGTGIPDEWLQETNVPIIQDNTYVYNRTYSKQNKENYYTHLRNDYDPDKTCLYEFPNRVIWSDKSSVEDTKNNWLIYRVLNYKDLPKTYGSLTSIDNLLNNELLVRYSGSSQIYNALTTLTNSSGTGVYIGTTNMFDAPPLDLSHADLGSAGSQHTLLLKTEFGNIYVDAQRGQVIMIGSSKGGFDILSNYGMSKWFLENLPFKAPGNPDNAFNGYGLTGVYDKLYKRFILTKRDIGGSWTMSFSFRTKSWVSFHSYVPNFYVPHNNHFQTGINPFLLRGVTGAPTNRDSTNIAEGFGDFFPTSTFSDIQESRSVVIITSDDEGDNILPDFEIPQGQAKLWNHNTRFDKFNNFYGILSPYTIEYPYTYITRSIFQTTSYKTQDELVQSVKEYANVRKYESRDNYYEPDETIYFNKSWLYNDQQCSGELILVPSKKNDLSARFSYPKYNDFSKEILVTKSDGFYKYNTFWDIVKDNNKSFFNTVNDFTKNNKELKTDNLDYSQRNYKKGLLRSKSLRIRHTLDNRDDVNILSRFIITETTISDK